MNEVVKNILILLGFAVLIVVIFAVLCFACYNYIWKYNIRDIKEIAAVLNRRFWEDGELWQEAILSVPGYRDMDEYLSHPWQYCTGTVLRNVEKYEEAVRKKYDKLCRRQWCDERYAKQRRQFAPLYDALRVRAGLLNLAIYCLDRDVKVWQFSSLDGGSLRVRLFGEYDYLESSLGDFLLDLDRAELKRQRLIDELGYQPEVMENFCEMAQKIIPRPIQRENERKERRQQERARIMERKDNLPNWLQKKERRAA